MPRMTEVTNVPFYVARNPVFRDVCHHYAFIGSFRHAGFLATQEGKLDIERDKDRQHFIPPHRSSSPLAGLIDSLSPSRSTDTISNPETSVGELSDTRQDVRAKPNVHTRDIFLTHGAPPLVNTVHLRDMTGSSYRHMGLPGNLLHGKD
jgi:hypothetical protein